MEKQNEFHKNVVWYNRHKDWGLIMARDKANIFKLDDEEFKEYENDPFKDCFESTKTFAEAFKKDIETKETPHVLLLEAEYGMGKTFFATRFTQYLDKQCKIDTIYFSVWENDYCGNPFIAFSKELIKAFKKKFKLKDKVGKGCKLAIDTFINVVKATSIDFSSIGLPISLDNGKLFENFKQDADPIQEFKSKLQDYIAEKTTSNKLIIIVDELDRCRPDYAMKTLECIKHFFDIEGLFIILPTNKNALNDSIQSLHGIDNHKRKDKENYFRKFFNDERCLKKPTEDDYKFIINQYINKETVAEALTKKISGKTLLTTGNNFNSITTLCNSLATYTHKNSLTVRELKDICKEIARMCNHFYEPIRCEWLACLMAYRKNEKDFNYAYPLSSEHCFYAERYASHVESKNGKRAILDLPDYVSVFKTFSPVNTIIDSSGTQINPYNYHNFAQKIRSNGANIQSYADVKNYFETELAEIEKLEKTYTAHSQVISNLKMVRNAIANQNEKIKEYQLKYGSDDFDVVRRKNYDEIVQNPEILYGTSNS